MSLKKPNPIVQIRDVEEIPQWGQPCLASIEEAPAALHDKDKPWLCNDETLKAEVEV